MKPVLKTSKFPISSLPRWPKSQKTMGTRLVSFGHKCRRLHEKNASEGLSLLSFYSCSEKPLLAGKPPSWVFDKVSMSVIFLIILFNQHFKPNCNEMIPALHALRSLRINNVTLGTTLGNSTSTYSSAVIGEIQIKITWNVLDALARVPFCPPPPPPPPQHFYFSVQLLRFCNDIHFGWLKPTIFPSSAVCHPPEETYFT